MSAFLRIAFFRFFLPFAGLVGVAVALAALAPAEAASGDEAKACHAVASTDGPADRIGPAGR